MIMGDLKRSTSRSLRLQSQLGINLQSNGPVAFTTNQGFPDNLLIRIFF